jgi:hypothetical protein
VWVLYYTGVTEPFIFQGGARTPAGVTDYCSPPTAEATCADIILSADECDISRYLFQQEKKFCY